MTLTCEVPSILKLWVEIVVVLAILLVLVVDHIWESKKQQLVHQNISPGIPRVLSLIWVSCDSSP